MKRAAVEKLRTRNVWLNHLRTHHGEKAACVCDYQMGRFRKGQRVGGCGNPRCWVCHSEKLGREPTIRKLRGMETFSEGLAETLLANNTFQRTVVHCGRPVLAMDGVLAGAERALCPAAELGR